MKCGDQSVVAPLKACRRWVAAVDWHQGVMH